MLSNRMSMALMHADITSIKRSFEKVCRTAAMPHL